MREPLHPKPGVIANEQSEDKVHQAFMDNQWKRVVALERNPLHVKV